MKNQPADDSLPVFGVAITEPRRRRFHEQLAGIPADATQPVVPSGLAPFMHLPAPEAATLTRARMAALVQSLVAANGQITRDELLGAGFDEREIARHFAGARRIAGVARMAV